LSQNEVAFGAQWRYLMNIISLGRAKGTSVIINIGQVSDLHIDTIVEAPSPDIYLGPRRRRDPGPPTTAALSKALREWEAGAEANANNG
jgi:hypothetical protein